MERKHQHFSRDQLDKLSKLELLRDRPRAEIVRQAVDEYLAKPDVKKELDSPVD